MDKNKPPEGEFPVAGPEITAWDINEECSRAGIKNG